MLLFLSVKVNAQNFDKGFRDGFKKTLSNERQIDVFNYQNYGEPSKCDNWGGTYSDGFTCGVKQATELLQQLKMNQAEKIKNAPKEMSIEEIDFNKPLENILADIENRKQDMIRNIDSRYGDQARNQMIQSLSIKTDNLVTVVKNRWNNIHNNSAGEEHSYNSNSDMRYNPQYVQQIMHQQQQSQENYNQQYRNTMNELSNSMRGLSNSMQALAMQNIQAELERRKNVANSFYTENSNRLNKLSNLYKQIPESKFKQILNGTYNGYFIMKKKYSFSNDNEIQTAIDCKVVVVNNIIKNIYLYGKKGFELDYALKYPDNSRLFNGIAKYFDYENLQESTIVVVEPFLNSNAKNNLVVSNDGVGYLSVWSNDKNDVGKKVYVQELNKNGTILREFETAIGYAKNSKESSNSNLVKIPFNTNNNFLFYGEVTETPYGRFPLFPKVSKDNNKPLLNNEHRFVEIKKYRE